MKHLVAWLIRRYRPLVWVHGVVLIVTREGATWDFLGAYSTREEALRACVDKNDFVFPARMGCPFDRHWKGIPGVEFPGRSQEGR